MPSNDIHTKEKISKTMAKEERPRDALRGSNVLDKAIREHYMLTGVIKLHIPTVVMLVAKVC